ncbi:MAG: hypothetical protein WCC90_23855 [Methylocella sp.]
MLDIELPDVSGLQVAQWIKADEHPQVRELPLQPM